MGSLLYKWSCVWSVENNAAPPRHTLAAGRCLVNPQIDCWLLLEDTAIENSSRKKLSTMWLRRQKCLPLSIYVSMHCFLFFSFFESVDNDPVWTPPHFKLTVQLIVLRDSFTFARIKCEWQENEYWRRKTFLYFKIRMVTTDIFKILNCDFAKTSHQFLPPGLVGVE